MDPKTLDALSVELTSSLLSDACDRLGLRARVVTPGVRPAWSGAVLCGIARVVHAEATGWQPISPYARQIEAIDALEPGEIVIATINNDPGCGLWGELFSTAASSRGARGALVDGNIRDSNRIASMRFPVFHRGFSPLDSLGRLEVVPDVRTAVVGGVEITSGDFVFGDIDGIVVLPTEGADDAIRVALEKLHSESGMRAELRVGTLLREAFERHRVL